MQQSHSTWMMIPSPCSRKKPTNNPTRHHHPYRNRPTTVKNRRRSRLMTRRTWSLRSQVSRKQRQSKRKRFNLYFMRLAIDLTNLAHNFRSSNVRKVPHPFHHPWQPPLKPRSNHNPLHQRKRNSQHQLPKCPTVLRLLSKATRNRQSQTATNRHRR